MKKILITLALLSFSMCQEETLIQLEEGGTLTNLNHLMSLDYSSLNCQTNFLQYTHQLKMWGELLEDKKVIHHEIKLLSTAYKILEQQRQNRLRNSNTLNRAKRVLAALRQNTHKKQHTIYQQWRVNEISHLKNQIHLLQTSATEDESKQCCDRIEQLINKFMEERKHIAKQCGNADITINIINDSEQKIEVINKKCRESDQDVKINRVDSIDKVIVGQKQEAKKEQVIVSQPKQQEQVVVQEVKQEEQVVVQEVKQEQQVVEQEVKQVEQVVVQEVKQEQQVVVQEVKQEEQVVVQEVKQEEQQVVEQEVKQEEQVVVQEVKQEQQVVVTQADQSESKSETKTEETTEETTEEVTEEVVTETVVTKTTSSKVVSQPDPSDDDEEVVGELVEAKGVGASGEGGRV